MTAKGPYLLDTNILLAYIRAGDLGKYVERTYQLQASPFQPLICVVSVGEVKAIAARNGWKTEKLARMDDILDKVVWIDISEPEVINGYVEAVNSRPKGLTIPQNDLWIGAATIATRACLLTTDGHFDYLANQNKIARELIDVKHGKPL